MTWLHTYALRAAALCSIAAGVACSGLTLPGSRAAAAIITPADATQVVRDFWRLNEKANTSSDWAAARGQIEGGLLQEADVADGNAMRALGLTSLTAARPLNRVAVYVPRQRSYPAEFVALLETVDLDQGGQLTSEPLAFYAHSVRTAEDERWIADFAAIGDLGRPLRFALDGDGYASSVALQAGGYVVTPSALGDAYVGYLSSGLASGTPRGPFTAGSRTTDAVRGARGFQESMARQGYRVSIDYSTRPYLHAYRGADGFGIVLFALQVTSTVQLADPSLCIIQPADNLRAWGTLVPPGSYSMVASDDLSQLIAIDPPARAASTVDLVAETYTDQVAARTVAYQLGHCP
jgi:hypothetical protein